MKCHILQQKMNEARIRDQVNEIQRLREVLIKQISRTRKFMNDDEKNCIWSISIYGDYDTGCGNSYLPQKDLDLENHPFCHRCGKEIKLSDYEIPDSFKEAMAEVERGEVEDMFPLDEDSISFENEEDFFQFLNTLKEKKETKDFENKKLPFLSCYADTTSQEKLKTEYWEQEARGCALNCEYWKNEAEILRLELAKLKDPVAVQINMVRGEIAYTREGLFWVLGIKEGSLIDVETLILECIPGGFSCDPQKVADNIRNYLTKQS